MAANTNITIMINGEATKREIFIRQKRELQQSRVNLNKVFLSALHYDHNVSTPFKCCNVAYMTSSLQTCGHFKGDKHQSPSLLLYRPHPRYQIHKLAESERKFTSRKECRPRCVRKLFYCSKSDCCERKLTTPCRCCICTDKFLIPARFKGKNAERLNNPDTQVGRWYTPKIEDNQNKDDEEKVLLRSKIDENRKIRNDEEYQSPRGRKDGPSSFRGVQKQGNEENTDEFPVTLKSSKTPNTSANIDIRNTKNKIDKNNQFFPSWKSENSIHKTEIQKTESFPNIRIADRIANLNTATPQRATSLESEKTPPPKVAEKPQLHKGVKNKRKLNRCASIGAVTDLKFKNGRLLKSSKTLSMFELRPDGWVHDGSTPRHKLQLVKNKLNLDEEVNNIHSTNKAAMLRIGNIKVIF